MATIQIEVKLEGTAADALYVANELLDQGDLQTLFTDHEFDAGPLGVTDARCHAVPEGVEPSEGRVVLVLGGEVVETTIAKFLEDNTEGLGAHELDAIRALGPGQAFQGGGGASVPWSLVIVSAPSTDG
ncbi:MAG: hypothetical protein ACHREM_00925 [Polyangiales bacterium]